MDWSLGDVYIIFGDVPRSDGSNIYGVYKNLSSAVDEVEMLTQRDPDTEYHVEEFGLWE